MEFMWDSLSDLLLGDAEGILPDVFQDEPSSIFQDISVSKSLIDQPEAPGLVVDTFPDWLDLKMDLSLLEGLECSDGVLNDFLMGDVTTGQSSDHQTHLEGKVLETSVNELPQEYPFDDAFHLEKGNTQFVLEDLLSPPYTPPSSPEGLVPDLGIPGSPVPSLVSISEPSSPAPVLIATSSTFTSAEPVFTFVAPILQPFQIGIIDVATVVSVESQALSIQSLTFTEEGDTEGSPASPDFEIVRVKKERKRKAASCDKDVTPKRRAKTSGEPPAPASKKERKRKQNKDAATRYRVKKRVECDVMLEEEADLIEENKKLKDKTHQLSTEITYLKGLMREMFKARGLM